MRTIDFKRAFCRGPAPYRHGIVQRPWFTKKYSPQLNAQRTLSPTQLSSPCGRKQSIGSPSLPPPNLEPAPAQHLLKKLSGKSGKEEANCVVCSTTFKVKWERIWCVVCQVDVHQYCEVSHPGNLP
ncbi:hypothetical protein ElyMa_001907600 [Elysia marginata]|uniref:Phorbol-ester/DAG-type domain-containing protein n=1 Tax=Elysia marginata TaxID=1093978 RepID=A0AAV4ETD6_9GAST|nr:hypothetical protein ElyMa_001907600 [Elysia marginata]